MKRLAALLRRPSGWALAAVALAGVGLRLWLATVSRMNSDDAIVGLMGMEILKGRHFAFYWGQGYMGSLEAYGAALAFLVAGVSPLVLRCVPLAFFLLAALFHTLLARELAGRDAARATFVLLLLSPAAFTSWTVAPRGGYMEALALGGAALLLGARIVRRPERHGPGAFLLLGLLAGLGFWTHYFFVYYLLPLAAALAAPLLRGPGRGSRGAALAAGFCLGASPAIAWNLRHSFASLEMGRQAGVVRLEATLTNLFGRQLPLLFTGDSLTSPATRPVQRLVIVTVLLFFATAGALWALQALRRRLPSPPAAALLPVGAVLTAFAAFAGTGFGLYNTQRYLLPVYPLAALFAAGAVATLGRRRPRAAALLLCLLAGFHVQGQWRHYAGPYLARSAAANRAAAQVVSYCRGRGITAAWGGHWVAYLLTFLSRQDLVVADLDRERYEPFQRRAREAPRPSLIVEGERRAFEDTLRAIGYRFEAATFGGYTVFAAPHLPPHLARQAGEVAARPAAAPGVWELPAPRRLNGLAFDAGSATWLRRLLVETSLDGVSWRRAARARGYRPGIFDDGGRLRVTRGPNVTLRFPPREARYLRLTLGGAPATPAAAPRVRLAPPRRQP